MHLLTFDGIFIHSYLKTQAEAQKTLLRFFRRSVPAQLIADVKHSAGERIKVGQYAVTEQKHRVIDIKHAVGIKVERPSIADRYAFGNCYTRQAGAIVKCYCKFYVNNENVPAKYAKFCIICHASFGTTVKFSAERFSFPT